MSEQQKTPADESIGPDEAQEALDIAQAVAALVISRIPTE